VQAPINTEVVASAVSSSLFFMSLPLPSRPKRMACVQLS
jgi:hypothetical protein